ncbi:helix-turn-helix domain-containing protein [Streptomyces millisiae]|uniref:helix-turn-helix domain-containing protein n=1 Tax=Streptomyces millisiae TaxID=3075542 RepID=UPI00374E1579
MANEIDPSDSMGALYGTRLRRYRLEAGWTQGDLGFRAHVVQSRINQLERATGAKPTLELSKKLDELLNTDGLLAELTPHVRREAFPDWAQEHLRQEGLAVSVRAYMNSVFHGLLQTRSYARTLLSQYPLLASAEELEVRLTARLERQARLADPKLRQFCVVLDEAVLMRPVGGSATMREQCARLLHVAKDPRFVFQVLPFAAGEHPVVGGSLTLLTLPDQRESAYVEGSQSGRLYEEKREVQQYQRAYDQIRAQSLPPHLSLELIQSVMEGRYGAARVPSGTQRRRLAQKQSQQRGRWAVRRGGGRRSRRDAGA